MKRLHIVGKKNSGKTTLIVDLVREYTSRGLRIGTVKHTHHRHELDTPGKDSHRHRTAGAAAVGILSSDMNAVFWPAVAEESSLSRYEQLRPLFDECDLILVEGHYQIEGNKIEVWRAATGNAPLAKDDPSIIAVVTDDDASVDQPQWSRSDIRGLADRIWKLHE